MKRTAFALALGVILSLIVAAAASLPVNGGVLQAGLDDTLVCDVGGVAVDGWGYENDTLMVSYVRIADISTDCEGAEMHVDVYDSGGSQIGDGGMWIVDTSGIHKFTFGSPVYAPDIYSIHVGITS